MDHQRHVEGSSARQLRALLASVPGRVEIVIHQRIPFLHMEHCLFAAHLSKAPDRSSCGHPCRNHRLALEDRNGELLPVSADGACRNTVFGPRIQSAVGHLADLVGAGARHPRIELTDEKADDVTRLLTLYGRLVAGLDDARTAWRRFQSPGRTGPTGGTLDRE